jgi:hypothetical protein
MAPRKILKSGSTSTFIPGGTGSSGTRAGVTFYGSKSQDAQTSNTITFRLNNENVTIDNQYGNILNPAINDFIVYADSNITYLLSIVDILESVCYTEVIDSWNTQSQSSGDQQTDISTISLDIECNASDSQDYIGYKKFISTSVISDISNLETAEYTGTNNADVLKMHSSCAFTFTISSINENPIGNYKVVIEFITDWSSPAMDTRIAKKFQTPKLYSGLNEYDEDDEVTQYQTFRGYFSNYSCKGINNEDAYTDICSECGTTVKFMLSNGKMITSCPTCKNVVVLDDLNPKNASENFDDEKLDNFVMTIKDYNQGVGNMSYKSTIYIPKDVIINAIDKNHPYKCNMYIYVNGINGSKEKVWMRDLSTLINNTVKLSDNDIYDDYKSTQTDGGAIILPEEPDLPIIIPDLTAYPGTRHAGQDSNMIYLYNTSESLQPRRAQFVEDDDILIDDDYVQNDPDDAMSYNDNVYVDNITVQRFAGTNNWCKCTYNAATHTVTYKAISQNPSTTSVRKAYFIHTTTDERLARGPHTGDLAMSQWTVTVQQAAKAGSSSGGGGGGGHVQPAVIIEDNDDRPILE